MSLDERSHNLVTLAAESFGRPGKEGNDLTDQLVASVVRRTTGGSLSRKGVCKKGKFKILSGTIQVAISRRLYRYKLALRDRQIVRDKRGEDAGLLSMVWGWHVDAE